MQAIALSRILDKYKKSEMSRNYKKVDDEVSSQKHHHHDHKVLWLSLNECLMGNRGKGMIIVGKNLLQK